MQRKKDFLGLQEILSSSHIITKAQQLVKRHGPVQGMSGQGRVISYFSVFPVYSFIIGTRPQLTRSWQNNGDSWYIRTNTVPSEKSSPVSLLFNTCLLSICNMTASL